MTDHNEKLIEEARRQMTDLDVTQSPDATRAFIRRLADALEATEKAHTPIDDEREALDYAIRVPIAARHVDHKPLWELIRAIQDSVVAAGFRRSEVPEPSAEVRQVLAWIDHTLGLPMYQGTIEGEYSEGLVDTLKTVRKMLNGTTRPDASWRTAEPQGEPSEAQVRKIAHTGPGHASGDAGYCEGCLVEREQRTSERIPGEPLTLEDLAREHERLAEHPNQMSQTIPAFHTLTAKALRWAALRAAGELGRTSRPGFDPNTPDAQTDGTNVGVLGQDEGEK